MIITELLLLRVPASECRWSFELPSVRLLASIWAYEGEEPLAPKLVLMVEDRRVAACEGRLTTYLEVTKWRSSQISLKGACRQQDR